MKFRKELLWDYDPKAIPKGKAFELFYLSRVLTRGGDRDLKEVGKKKIRTLLPELNLPPRIRSFWEWYFGKGEHFGTSLGSSTGNTPPSRPDRD